MSRIALQMDPLDRINHAGDSTVALALAAQERGHALFHYTPKDMTWLAGKLTARASKAQFRAEGDTPYALEAPRTLDLANDVDVILLRQDPPYDMTYLTSTYLLDLVKEKTRIFNDPTGVRSSPEKLLTTHFFHLIPKTLITADRAAITAFFAQTRDVVVKRLYGNAGREVWRFKHGESATDAFLDTYFAQHAEPLLFQPFLPEVMQGDKRIILFGGEPVGAVNRVPKAGEFRANLALGATGEAAPLTSRDLEICAELAPMLKLMGLYFVGIDVIGPWLSEINTTSPTGIRIIDRLYGYEGENRLGHRYWQKLGL